MWPFKENIPFKRDPINTQRGLGGNSKFDAAFDQVKMFFGLLWDRVAMYNDYEYMMQDAIISSALELYTEDATQASPETNKPFWISTTSEFLEREFTEFCTRLDLYRNYTDICYNLCLYGDLFPRLYWGNTNEGLIYIDHKIHPADVEKASIGGYTLGYRYDNRMFTPKDFYHLKLCFSKMQRREWYNWMIVKIDGYDFRVRSDYGTSVLENARKIYKIMNLLENCLVVARLSRSPLQQIIGIQFGEDTTNTEALAFLNKMKEALAEENTIDQMTQTFESSKQTFKLLNRMFIPLFGEKGSLQVENLNGAVDIKDIVDIEYFQSKLYGALRTPKAYLGMEESLPGSLGESALARLEVRYGKNVKRVKTTLLQFLTDMFTMHLIHIGKQDLLGEFLIEGAVISTKEEEERKNALEKSMSIMSSVVDTFSSLEIMPEEKAGKQTLLKNLNRLFLKIPGFNELFETPSKKEELVDSAMRQAVAMFRIKENEDKSFWEHAERMISTGMLEMVVGGNAHRVMKKEEALLICRNKLEA